MLNIHLHKVSKRYGANWIIRNVVYHFEAGQFYSIQGPNGSGKSTLLKIISGYLSPSYGELEYTTSDGHKIDREDIYKELSMAAPYLELIESLRVSEMVRFQMKLKPFYRDWSCEALLDFAYLGASSQLYLWELSSGMLQRLKLALAMATQSKFLILDEPGTNLDLEAKEWYLNSLKEMSFDRTIIIASNEVQDFPEGATELHISQFK